METGTGSTNKKQQEVEQEKVIFLTSPFSSIATGNPSPYVWATFNPE